MNLGSLLLGYGNFMPLPPLVPVIIIYLSVVMLWSLLTTIKIVINNYFLEWILTVHPLQIKKTNQRQVQIIIGKTSLPSFSNQLKVTIEALNNQL